MKKEELLEQLEYALDETDEFEWHHEGENNITISWRV